jgi:hypothetical protein
MPIYEFQTPSGVVLQDFFPVGSRPDFIEVEEDGETVKAKRIISGFGFNAATLAYHRDNDDELMLQKANFQKPIKSLGYNPDTGTHHSMATHAASGQSEARGLAKKI